MACFLIQAGVHTSPVRSLRYGWWTYVLGDRTTPRLSQNSKIISVDGSLASGKGALAQKLADKLGMFVPSNVADVDHQPPQTALIAIPGPANAKP